MMMMMMISILILFPRLRLGLPRGFLPSGFRTKTLYEFLLSIRATCTANLIVLALPILTSREEYYHKNLHYALFSSFLLLPRSEVQIFSSAPHSRTPSAHVLPIMTETKFHTHTQQKANLWFCMF